MVAVLVSQKLLDIRTDPIVEAVSSFLGQQYLPEFGYLERCSQKDTCCSPVSTVNKPAWHNFMVNNGRVCYKWTRSRCVCFEDQDGEQQLSRRYGTRDSSLGLACWISCDPHQSWWMEVTGFRDASYESTKIRALQACGENNCF